jgi:Lon protease-like protein
MPMNVAYHNPGDLADVIPVFPLAGALLLPRGQMPLNIFEPRYLAMIDDALRSGLRLIGMIQPDPAHPGTEERPGLYKIGCVGRITQVTETGDGRYLIELTGVVRFRVDEELRVSTPYRQSRLLYTPFIDDFTARKGEDAWTARRVAGAARFSRGQRPQGRLEGTRNAQRSAGQRVAMMSPYPAAETGLAGSTRLKTRAEIWSWSPRSSWLRNRRRRTPCSDRAVLTELAGTIPAMTHKMTTKCARS